jgi:hypothetical protein
VGLLGTGRINAYNALQNSTIVQFNAAPRSGPAPLTVNFSDESPATITRQWDFGDGNYSTDETPSNEYTAPGLYDVSLEVTDPNGTLSKTKRYFIHAMADTVTGDSITNLSPVGSTAYPVPINIKNTVPVMSFTLVFDWVTEDGTADLDFEYVDLAGTRGEVFDTAIVRAISSSTGKVAIQFIATEDGTNKELPAGEGPVANLYFDPAGGGTVRFDTTSLIGYEYEFECRFVEYVPEYLPFRVRVGLRGDANGDGELNAGDPVFLINYVFKGGPAPETVFNGDANADGSVNVADAVYLINYIFKGGPPPPA